MSACTCSNGGGEGEGNPGLQGSLPSFGRGDGSKWLEKGGGLRAQTPGFHAHFYLLAGL